MQLIIQSSHLNETTINDLLASSKQTALQKVGFDSNF